MYMHCNAVFLMMLQVKSAGRHAGTPHCHFIFEAHQDATLSIRHFTHLYPALPDAAAINDVADCDLRFRVVFHFHFDGAGAVGRKELKFRLRAGP